MPAQALPAGEGFAFCSDCKKNHSIEEFSIKNKVTQKRRTICKACQRIRAKDHYEKNKTAYLQKAASTNDARRFRSEDLIKDHLSGRVCRACGGTHDLFHYRGGHENGKPVWALLDTTSDKLLEALNSSEIWCKACFGLECGRKLAAWNALTQEQKALSKKPPGYFKNYRSADQNEQSHLCEQVRKAEVRQKAKSEMHGPPRPPKPSKAKSRMSRQHRNELDRKRAISDAFDMFLRRTLSQAGKPAVDLLALDAGYEAVRLNLTSSMAVAKFVGEHLFEQGVLGIVHHNVGVHHVIKDTKTGLLHDIETYAGIQAGEGEKSMMRSRGVRATDEVAFRWIAQRQEAARSLLQLKGAAEDS